MNEPHYTSLAELQERPLPPGFETITGPLPHSLFLLHYSPDDIVEIEIKNPIRLGKRVEDKKYNIDYWARLFKATTWEELRMLAQEQKELQSTIETIYRVSADDYTLAEIRAREDELRLQRTLENETRRRIEKLAEQQKKIAEQQVTIDTQQNTIDTQQSTIDTQQSTINELQAENARLKALFEGK